MFDAKAHITVLEKKYKTKDASGFERWQTRNVDYLTVQWRLVWFREQCPHGTIETELLHYDLEGKVAICKATVKDGQGGIATGHKMARATPQFSDFLEKAETGSIGRALAGLGFGTQFADDFDEDDLLVNDAPQKNTEQLPSASSSPVVVSAPSAKALEKRCVQLFGQGKWAALKTRHLGVNINDDSLTPEQCLQLKTVMDAAEASARQRKQTA